MTRKATTYRYSIVAILFHWTIAALIVFNIVVALWHDDVPVFRAMMPAHEAIGIAVLILTIGRIVWRLGHHPPPLPDQMAWQKSTSHAMHGIFYALLLILPLTGWALVSGAAAPHPLSWFGIVDVPLLPVSNGVGHVSHALHELLGKITAVLVLMHVTAALSHHFVLRDGLLMRMAPALRD